MMSIILIPKVQRPQDFTQYRSISLCNFINKVISQILSDRLATILPCIISTQHSNFVKRKQITDNFILTKKLLTDIKMANRGGNMVVKLDMMKAYNTVS